MGPTGIAVDSKTNLYVADLGNNSIRKIVPTGENWVVATIAGSTTAGFGDGTGLNARFNMPNGIACAGEGIFYVPEFGNSTVRRLEWKDNTWTVSTVGGVPGITGLVDGTGSAARFYHPVGVACDSIGNIYIGDIDNHVIRKGWADGTRPAGRFETPAIDSTEAALSFTVTTGSVTNIVLWRSDEPPGSWTVDSSAKLAILVPNVNYRIKAPIGNARGFFRAELK